jgi:plasmid stabilization system protein ParE
MAVAADLEGIANYLYLHHPEFATTTIQRLYDAAKSLPLLGPRRHQERHTRTGSFAASYLMIYAVDDHSVQILRFLHTAQDRP